MYCVIFSQAPPDGPHAYRSLGCSHWLGHPEDRATLVYCQYTCAGSDAFADAPLSIAPSATVFHYAQGLFEGLKAYRDNNGRVTLFRPDMNMARMNSSAQRIALPTFNPESMQELIAELVRVDQDWIPQEPGHSLYIRPTMSEC